LDLPNKGSHPRAPQEFFQEGRPASFLPGERAGGLNKRVF